MASLHIGVGASVFANASHDRPFMATLSRPDPLMQVMPEPASQQDRPDKPPLTGDQTFELPDHPGLEDYNSDHGVQLDA